MLRNKLYYAIKPMVPRTLRVSVRSAIVKMKRRAVADRWPILPGSHVKPEGWPGWPQGKQFAVALSHDVESAVGVAKSPDLAALERQYGFRSSFNFIPAGGYQVSPELRKELVEDGFEIGVHDLHHDGKLYQTHAGFTKKAQQINKVLKEWGAVGFRSGFMLRNLDWIHELDIAYDASTFDTDPFEPMPDGAETIFPFWIPKPANSTAAKPGYMELPYTLPQDSTVFLLFGESDSQMWKRKVDWLAEHGGMVLVNVHPDYLAFDGKPVPTRDFPAARYAELLEYIATKYAGQYWHALPRQVAEYCETFKPQRPSSRRRNVCMVSFSAYESDNRVMRYAEALGARGDNVDILAVKRFASQPNIEQIGHVNVHRLQHRAGKNHRGKLAYLVPLLRFWCACSWWLLRRTFRKRYDLLHIHNVPDFLVFAGWAPKLAGARVILDIHDIVPEFYVSKFEADPDGMVVRLLKKIERAAASFSDHVIISNHLWYDKLVERSVAREKCTAVINHVDSHIFYPRKRIRTDGKFIILFPGGLQWHQGLDIAIRAFAKIVNRAPGVEFHIYGDGNKKEELIALAQSLNLNGLVKFNDPLPISQIASVMANADLGVVPKRANSFGNEAYSTKIMEFMSMGVPVVISRTKIDSFYFNENVVRFFESGNEEALAQGMLELIENKEVRQKLITNAFSYVAQNNWEKKRPEYFNLVDSLTSSKARKV